MMGAGRSTTGGGRRRRARGAGRARRGGGGELRSGGAVDGGALQYGQAAFQSVDAIAQVDPADDQH